MTMVTPSCVIFRHISAFIDDFKAKTPILGLTGESLTFVRTPYI